MAGPKLMTAVEAARAVSRLTGRKCTARRVRHLLVQSQLGTELQQRQRGQTRLFGVLDLAIMRLAIELDRQGVSSWVTRVVLTYLRNDIVMAFKSAAPVALAISGLKGSVLPALKARPGGTVAWVPLRDVWKGIEAEIGEVRTAKPTVWMYRDVPLTAVKRSTV
jgi:hypothetical protein